MRIITDIDPASPESPSPASAWRTWSRQEALRPFLNLCFPTDPPLVETEISGQKLSRQFPLVIWQQYASHSQIDLLSTALRQGMELPANLVLVASHGLAFRGHFDRRWVAEAGNLHTTVFVRDEIPILKAGMGYAVLPVLTLLDLVRSLAGSTHPVGVKWMNDIVFEGRKVGGALSKTRTQGGLFTEAMLGMGLNTHQTPAVGPNVFVPRVGSLGRFAAERPVLEVLIQALSAFAANHFLLLKRGGQEMVGRYRRDWLDLNRPVRIYDDGTDLDDCDLTGREILARGVAEAIDSNMCVVIGGKPIGRGRLAYEEDCQAFGL